MGWGILGGEDVEFWSAESTLQAHIGRPGAPGRFPAVIMLHGINGPGPGNRRAAERLGEEGYAFYQELSEKKPRHPYDLADRIQTPLIMLHGAADDRSPAANMYRLAQRLEELGKQFELTVYSGTGHAFTLPDGGAYNPEAASDSWQRAINFLDRHLRA